MQDWVWCFVEPLSLIIFFLDVSVDGAPLLAVAKLIQAQHAGVWAARVVRMLLCETPLVCTLRRMSAEIVRGELEERGLATDASPYYEWCALDMHLSDAMFAWLDRRAWPPTYAELYDIIEEGVPWLQRLRERWSSRLREAFERWLSGYFMYHEIDVNIRADRLGFTWFRTEPWQLGALHTVQGACRRQFDAVSLNVTVAGRLIAAMRGPPLCSLAAVASGLVDTEVLGGPGTLGDGDGAPARLPLPPFYNNPPARRRRGGRRRRRSNTPLAS